MLNHNTIVKYMKLHSCGYDKACSILSKKRKKKIKINFIPKQKERQSELNLFAQYGDLDLTK